MFFFLRRNMKIAATAMMPTTANPPTVPPTIAPTGVLDPPPPEVGVGVGVGVVLVLVDEVEVGVETTAWSKGHRPVIPVHVAHPLLLISLRPLLAAYSLLLSGAQRV